MADTSFTVATKGIENLLKEIGRTSEASTQLANEIESAFRRGNDEVAKFANTVKAASDVIFGTTDSTAAGFEEIAVAIARTGVAASEAAGLAGSELSVLADAASLLATSVSTTTTPAVQDIGAIGESAKAAADEVLQFSLRATSAFEGVDAAAKETGESTKKVTEQTKQLGITAGDINKVASAAADLGSAFGGTVGELSGLLSSATAGFASGGPLGLGVALAVEGISRLRAAKEEAKREAEELARTHRESLAAALETTRREAERLAAESETLATRIEALNYASQEGIGEDEAARTLRLNSLFFEIEERQKAVDSLEAEIEREQRAIERNQLRAANRSNTKDIRASAAAAVTASTERVQLLKRSLDQEQEDIRRATLNRQVLLQHSLIADEQFRKDEAERNEQAARARAAERKRQEEEAAAQLAAHKAALQAELEAEIEIGSQLAEARSIARDAAAQGTTEEIVALERRVAAEKQALADLSESHKDYEVLRKTIQQRLDNAETQLTDARERETERKLAADEREKQALEDRLQAEIEAGEELAQQREIHAIAAERGVEAGLVAAEKRLESEQAALTLLESQRDELENFDLLWEIQKQTVENASEALAALQEQTAETGSVWSHGLDQLASTAENAMSSVANAIGGALEQWALYSAAQETAADAAAISSEEAANNAAAQAQAVLASLASIAAVEAVMEGARALAALAQKKFPEAATHGIAAGMFAGVAGVAAAGARAIGASRGETTQEREGREQQDARDVRSDTTTDRAPTTSEAPQVNVYVQGTSVANDVTIARAVAKAMTRNERYA